MSSHSAKFIGSPNLRALIGTCEIVRQCMGIGRSELEEMALGLVGLLLGLRLING